MNSANNAAFNTILFGASGYLVGAVHGRQYWTDQKQYALRFMGAGAAGLMARSLPVATVTQDYFDDAVDPAILRERR